MTMTKNMKQKKKMSIPELPSISWLWNSSCKESKRKFSSAFISTFSFQMNSTRYAVHCPVMMRKGPACVPNKTKTLTKLSFNVFKTRSCTSLLTKQEGLLTPEFLYYYEPRLWMTRLDDVSAFVSHPYTNPSHVYPLSKLSPSPPHKTTHASHEIYLPSFSFSLVSLLSMYYINSKS